MVNGVLSREGGCFSKSLVALRLLIDNVRIHRGVSTRVSVGIKEGTYLPARAARWSNEPATQRHPGLGGVERLKPACKVGLEILDMLEPDVEPQRRAVRRPFGGGAIACAVEWNDKALEAAP